MNIKRIAFISAIAIAVFLAAIVYMGSEMSTVRHDTNQPALVKDASQRPVEQPVATPTCGQEGDSLGGDIDHCCAGLKPAAAKPQLENGAPGGRFECSKI